jgi:ferredoxin
MKRRPARRFFQFLAAGTAAALALPLLPWEPAARLLPALSPLLSLGGALARRAAWPAALLGLPVLLLALTHKRWFCFHACPTGLCAESLGRLNPRAAARFGAWPRLGGGLALLLIGSAAAGYPLALGLDPLALFNGFFSAWRKPLDSGLPPLAAGFLIVLLLSLLRPHLWCLRLCPLGGLQDGLHGLVRAVQSLRSDGAGAESAPARRVFLGAAIGGLGGLLLRRRPAGTAVLRPPGAAPEARFTGLCARCGACMRACPPHIIFPDLGEAGAAGLLAPKLQYGNGYCLEACRACTGACPTGALRDLSLDQKRRLTLGGAVVEKGRCLAWKDGLFCMACKEACPYAAIRAVERKGVNCPVVDPGLCRGCGACENACPASPRKAITVRAAPQRELPERSPEAG